MKKTFVMILILIASVVNAGDNAPWVDMVNCPICKNVSAEEGLAENMKWEHHLTSTGMMSVFTISPEFQPKFDRAKAGMMEKIGEVLNGEKLDICGYCTSVTSLLKEGVKTDNIITHSGDVTLISSTDEAMIAKIQTHGQKIIKFLSPSHENHKH